MPATANRRCPDCGTYLARATSCLRCSTVGGTRPGSNRAFAQNLRTQITNGTPAGAPTSTGSGTLTGQVIREQETWTGRAGGTTPLILLGLGVPMAVSLATDRAHAASAASGLLAALLVPFVILVLLSALIGRRGRFLHRAARSSLALGAGVAGYAVSRRRGRGGPGKMLIVRRPTDDARVLVARDLDVPIGSTVHVQGPHVGGYTHAWKVRVDGLDDRWFLTRGVALAVFCAVFGMIACVIELVGLVIR